MGLKEMLENQRRFDIMDRHLGEQRVIDELTEKLEKRVTPIEKRVNVLEHYRTAIGASIAAILAYLKYGPKGGN